MSKKSNLSCWARVVCAFFMALNLVACNSGSPSSGSNNLAASEEKTVLTEAAITDPVSIEGTPKTPTVALDAVTGVLEIKGRSIPENSIEFYRLLTEWLDSYAKSPAKITQMNVWFSSINPGSRNALMVIFKKLEGIHKGGSPVVIHWHYTEGNLDMLETGEKYRASINVHFKMVQVAERR